MMLLHGIVYRTPDSRRFEAQEVFRRYDAEQGFMLVPREPIRLNHNRFVDDLANCLFLEQGRLFFFDVSGIRPVAHDSGWTIDDLKIEEAVYLDEHKSSDGGRTQRGDRLHSLS